jgi:uncharacterized membrane protein
MAVTDLDTSRGKFPLPRWAMLLLVASLAFNVMIVGLVAGAVWRAGGIGGLGAPRNAGGSNMGYVFSLPTERRDQLLSRAGSLRQQVMPMRREVRQAARARNEALLAEPFDRDRFLAAQAQLIEAEGRMRMVMSRMLADAAAGMTPEERRAFAHWRGGGGRRGGMMPDSDDDPRGPPPRR